MMTAELSDINNTRTSTADSALPRSRSPTRGGVDKNSVFLSFDHTDPDVSKRVHILKRKLQQSGKTVFQHDVSLIMDEREVILVLTLLIDLCQY